MIIIMIPIYLAILLAPNTNLKEQNSYQRAVLEFGKQPATPMEAHKISTNMVLARRMNWAMETCKRFARLLDLPFPQEVAWTLWDQQPDAYSKPSKSTEKQWLNHVDVCTLHFSINWRHLGQKYRSIR
jgi:hypothetical protein